MNSAVQMLHEEARKCIQSTKELGMQCHAWSNLLKANERPHSSCAGLCTCACHAHPGSKLLRHRSLAPRMSAPD